MSKPKVLTPPKVELEPQPEAPTEALVEPAPALVADESPDSRLEQSAPNPMVPLLEKYRDDRITTSEMSELKNRLFARYLAPKPAMAAHFAARGAGDKA